MVGAIEMEEDCGPRPCEDVGGGALHTTPCRPATSLSRGTLVVIGASGRQTNGCGRSKANWYYEVALPVNIELSCLRLILWYQRDMKGRRMTMHIHTWPTLIILLIASMLQTACGSDTAPATSAPPDLAPPEAHVRDVYIDWIRYDGNPLNDRLYADPDRFTADFIQRIDAMQNTPGGIGIDPLLCAQEVPIDFGTSLIRASDQTASVMVHMLWTSAPAALTTHSVQVELTASDGQWRIDNIICPAASYWWYTA